MVYKKFIRRGGKSYGPYYYKSKKVNGKVITEYIGGPDYKSNFSKKFSSFFLSGIIVSLFVLSIFFFNISLTGKISSDITTTYTEGEILKGILNFNLKEGELIPADAKVIVKFGSATKEFLLSDLIDEEIISGDYFIENFGVLGEGIGYGAIGSKKVYPDVSFQLKILDDETIVNEESQLEDETDEPQLEDEADEPQSEDETIVNDEPQSEDETIVNDEPQSEDETIVNDEPQLEDEADEPQLEDEADEPQSEDETIVNEESQLEVETETEIVEEVGTSSESEEQATAEDDGESEASSAESGESSSERGNSGGRNENAEERGRSPITGEVILENLISGVASKGNNFEYEISDGKSAELITGSVSVEGEIISDSEIKIRNQKNKVVVSTNYFYEEEGFGEEYLSKNEKKKLQIELEYFNFSVDEDADLSIFLVYENTTITEVSEHINLIDNIPDEEIENVTEIFNETIINETLNETIINETVDVYNISTIQYGAVVGKPVKWKKKITDDDGILNVEVPKEAENISVYKLNEIAVSDYEEEEVLNETPIENESEIFSVMTGNSIKNFEKTRINAKVISGEVSAEIELEENSFITNFFKKIFSVFTGRVVDVLETEETKEVLIQENATEFEIEYTTPGPVMFEEDTSKGKNILISSDVHYENILAYTEFSNAIPESSIKLYLTTDGKKEQVEFRGYNDDEVYSAKESLDSFSTVEGELISSRITESVDLTNEAIFGGEKLVKYIEWIVPSLSNQSYEIIIEITKAEHLDENKSFIKDVYDFVKVKDGDFVLINDLHYLRVTFEKNLISDNDITIYARAVNESSSIEVYTENSDELIATFENISGENWYKVYLTDLNGEEDTFDLKSIGNIEYDYVVDPSGVAWDLSFAVYDEVYVSTRGVNPMGLSFKSDGTKMYEIGYDNKIYQFDLSTAWDISSASYNSIYKDLTLTDEEDLFFHPNGTYVYILKWADTNNLYRCPLSTAWNISTVSCVHDYKTTQGNSTALFFKPDGTKMYEVDYYEDQVYSYNLSTAWAISSAVYDSVTGPFSIDGVNPQGLFFKPDGTKMYALCSGDDKIHQYTLSTAWDISTASYDDVYISTQDSNPTGLFFKSDGTKMYEIGSSGDKIYQYTFQDTAYPQISFVSPTPDNDETTTNTSVTANVSIIEENLDEFKWNWNGTNFTIFNDSLVLMMNFDNVSALGENDTLVKDVSGNGNDGTCSDCPSWTSDGKYNGGFSFDGVNDYIDIPTFELGTAFTYNAWVDWPADNVIRTIFDNDADTRWLGQTSTSQLAFYDGADTLLFGQILSEGWHMVTVTYDSAVGSNNLIGYADGVGLANTHTKSYTAVETGWLIGDDGYDHFWNGSIDEVRIYNRSLSAEEIQQLYMSNLYKYDTDKWAFYINQTKNATDVLDEGTYTYQAFAKDEADNWNSTEERSITIGEEPPSANRFIIKDILGNNVASIDDKGDIYLKGIKLESQSSLTPTVNSFIIKNVTGGVLAYINSTGSLFLKGTSDSSSDMSGLTTTNLEFRNSTSDLVVFFDNEGNLKLKGHIYTMYEDQ
jgi:hypothetical protein